MQQTTMQPPEQLHIRCTATSYRMPAPDWRVRRHKKGTRCPAPRICSRYAAA